MQSPNDWRDIEITGYLKLNAQGGVRPEHREAYLVGITQFMQEEDTTQEVEHLQDVKQLHTMESGIMLIYAIR